MDNSKPGKLVVISGPSGSGKTSIVKRLVAQCDLPLKVSVSATTRPSREGERHGIDYYFFAPEEFEIKRQAGEFLECFEVYGRSYWYGTLRDEVTTSLQSGKWIILEIDVQGMQAIVDQFPDAITIFVMPTDMNELERRLRGRGTETEERVCHRLSVARRELQFADQYHFQVVNRSLDQTVNEICGILTNCSDSGGNH